jgi:hypothetical protein
MMLDTTSRSTSSNFVFQTWVLNKRKSWREPRYAACGGFRFWVSCVSVGWSRRDALASEERTAQSGNGSIFTPFVTA